MFTKEEREIYDARVIWLSGKHPALQKAFAEGIEKGIIKERVEMAKILLASGVSIDIISKSTGLPERDLEELNNDTTNDKSIKIRKLWLWDGDGKSDVI